MSEPTITITFNRMRRIDHSAVQYDDYCTVCRRSTDHFGEHDDLIDLGLAENVVTVEYYTMSDGRTVHPTYWRDIVPTAKMATWEGQRLVEFLSDGHRAHFKVWSEGKVSLIKPVGYAITMMAALSRQNYELERDAAELTSTVSKDWF